MQMVVHHMFQSQGVLPQYQAVCMVQINCRMWGFNIQLTRKVYRKELGSQD